MSHIIQKYDIYNYNFSRIVSEFFGISDLGKLHILDNELCNSGLLQQDNEADTFFHNKFYKKLNDGWPEINQAYKNFITNEASPLFSEDFLYQKFPSFRVQVPNQIAVSKWHYDSDEDHLHPDWEINFQIALTNMQDTSATWVETVPGLSDFKPMNLKVGEYSIFNGNKCRHGNKPNTSDKTRVSFDFRVLPISRFDENNPKTSYYGKKFSEGGYYNRFRKSRKNV